MGTSFKPTEEELIILYLKPKILGQKLPNNEIKERQVYGPNSNPWEVFKPDDTSWITNQVTPERFEKIMYVFVKLTKKASNAVDDQKKKKMIGREKCIKKAGCGTWDGKTGRVKIKDANGNVIGERRLLIFQINQAVDDDDRELSSFGYWKMHEYSLCGVDENVDSDGYVICKITFDNSKKCHVKLRPNVRVSKRGRDYKAEEKAKNIHNGEGSGSLKSESLIIQSNHHQNMEVVESYYKGVNDSIDDEIWRLATEISPPRYVKEDFCMIQDRTSSEIDRDLQMELSKNCGPVESDSGFLDIDQVDDDNSDFNYLDFLSIPDDEELTVEEASDNGFRETDEKKDGNCPQIVEAKLPVQNSTTSCICMAKRNSEDEASCSLTSKKSCLCRSLDSM